MICPVCKTNNTDHTDAQCCAQCGSDLYVHRLLRGLGERVQMKNEIAEESPRKLNWLLVIGQAGATIFLVGCAIFGIVVGMHFLTFMEREEAYHISMAHNQSEINHGQLQQMSATIKQGFDFILDQRRENQVLQARIQELEGIISKNTQKKSALSPNPNVREMH